MTNNSDRAMERVRLAPHALGGQVDIVGELTLSM